MGIAESHGKVPDVNNFKSLRNKGFINLLRQGGLEDAEYGV